MPDLVRLVPVLLHRAEADQDPSCFLIDRYDGPDDLHRPQSRVDLITDLEYVHCVHLDRRLSSELITLRLRFGLIITNFNFILP